MVDNIPLHIRLQTTLIKGMLGGCGVGEVSCMSFFFETFGWIWAYVES